MVAAAVLLVLVALPGCRTAQPSRGEPVQAGLEVLARPLSGGLAALYRMRVPKTGGLRLVVLTLGNAGRLTVSEPFGSPVSILAWRGPGAAELADLKKGCRSEVSDASAILGVRGLPLPQAARLLGGRLPALPGDRVTVVEAPWVEVEGPGFGFRVRLAADPWRVVEVEGPGDPPAWRIMLDRHTVSVPRSIRAEAGRGRWVELELVRLEWDTVERLPELPDLPPCG